MTDPGALRALLPRCWYAFFGRFGGRLLPVQQVAIPTLVAGQDAVLVSPTASGKTEAAAAPLCERLLAGASRTGPGVIYVTPTRALANDLLRRLEGPCSNLGVTVARRTGDHPTSMARKTLPDIVITTPESLDSLLCRRASAFKDTFALVLDEVHLLMSSGRGDHLALLVSRVRKVARDPVQTVVLSATLADAEAIGRRYALCPEVHRGGETRPLSTLFLSRNMSLPAALTAAVHALDLRKVLAFCESRAEVESVANQLRDRTPFGDGVFTHHGSLERRVREWVEAQFLSRPRALCIATSTLEVGIDIGDVDAVLLLQQPASVASLLQRAGRGNRRDATCRLLVHAPGVGDRLWQENLLACAAQDNLCVDPIPFRPGVLAQQALSLAFQNRHQWVSAAALHERLPPDVALQFDLASLEAILEGLQQAEWLEPEGRNRYRPSEKACDAFRRGRTHSVISPRPAGVDLIDEVTGENLGSIAKGAKGEHLGLAGRRWQVVGEGHRELRVRSTGKEATAPTFITQGRPTCSLRLCQAFRQALGIPPGGFVFLPTAKGQGLELFHFLGTARSAVLAAAVACSAGVRVERPGALAFTVRSTDPSVLSPPSAAAMHQAVLDRASTVARQLGNGPLTSALPQPLVERFALQALDPKALADLVGRLASMTHVSDEHVQALRELRRR